MNLLARLAVKASAAALALTLVPACGILSNLNHYQVSDDAALGAEAYPELLAGETVVQSGADHRMVNRLTQRLVTAARELDPAVASQFDWEVRLVEQDEVVNAWCLPGGKMAGFTGILPIAEDETGLAVVMSHEIAHATLRHGTKRMTRQDLLTQLIEAGAEAYAEDAETKQQTEALASDAAHLLVSLPFGRDAEIEADTRGLMYMAHAGYDPRAAVGFWERMSSASGSAPFELFSTHPSDERRIEQIREALPAAIAAYEQSLGSR